MLEREFCNYKRLFVWNNDTDEAYGSATGSRMVCLYDVFVPCISDIRMGLAILKMEHSMLERPQLHLSVQSLCVMQITWLCCSSFPLYPQPPASTFLLKTPLFLWLVSTLHMTHPMGYREGQCQADRMSWKVGFCPCAIGIITSLGLYRRSGDLEQRTVKQ